MTYLIQWKKSRELGARYCPFQQIKIPSDIYDSSEAREQCPSATQHTPGPHSVLRGKKKLSQHSPPSCLGLFSFACSHDLNEGEVKSFTFTFNR